MDENITYLNVVDEWKITFLKKSGVSINIEWANSTRLFFSKSV